MQIIPSVFTTNLEQFTHQIQSMNTAVDCVQIDVTDGEFVPTLTFADPLVTKNILQISCELHLMVIDPLKILQLWKDVPQVKRILFHYESGADVSSTIDVIHSYGWEAGLVLNPHTPLSVTEPFISKLDSVMFMGVVPGAQGQALIPEVLVKAKELKQKNPQMFTEWDGAVSESTLPSLMDSDLSAICPGSAVFKNGEPADNIQRLKQIINKN